MTSESTAPNPQAVGRLAAFRYRDFRLFWISLFISNIGTWMQMTAVNWLLYQLTDSPVQLGLNGVFRAVRKYSRLAYLSLYVYQCVGWLV